MIKAIKQSGRRLPFHTGFYYGWVMVLVSGMGIFFSGPGQTFSNSVFIDSYVKDLSLRHSTISSIYSAATLVSGLLLFLIGRLVDRYGRRIMLALAGLMLGVSCLFSSMVAGPIMLFFSFFMVRYFGQGSMTLIPNTLVSQWFLKFRGRAISFASLGGLVGAASFPPLITWMISDYGWQLAWRMMGIVLICLFVPLALYLVRNQPEDVDLLPDGLNSTNQDQTTPSIIEQEISWQLSEVIRARSFWFVMICGMIPAMINTGITFHIFTLMAAKGVERMETAFALSLIPIVSFGCSLLSGFIVERVKVNRMLSLSLTLSALSPIFLIFADSYLTILLFAVLWGMTQGLMNIPLGVIWPNYYGRKYLGSIQSVTHAAGVIGSALGPVLFGGAIDKLGSYTPMLIISTFIWLIGAGLALLSKPPQRGIS